MLFVEWDWSLNVYRLRFGTSFIDCRGERSWPNKAELLDALRQAGLRLGEKTDTRTYRVELEG